MRTQHLRFWIICAGATSFCALMAAAESGSAYANTVPSTTAQVMVEGGATDGNFGDQQSFTNLDAPSLASTSKVITGSDGSIAGASATAFADFGTLGVRGSAGSSAALASSRAVGSASAVASASWGDFLTAIPNPGSLLVPGTSVTATLTLGLDFQNSLLALNNAQGGFAYELFAGIVFTDPITGAQSSLTALDDCFAVGDFDFQFCGVGSTHIGIPGNTSGPLAVQLAPIALPLAILQPFELGVGLTFDGQCNAGPGFDVISSCTFDGDALHTSTATLHPLGDFTLVAASGHDYASTTPTPTGNVAEPATLALIGCGLAPMLLSSRLRRRKGRVNGLL